ncbi:hypothetical protein LTR09_007316 [Extremus antarcticus]|uniref:TATA element modulatory factor 1 TATA binding domain-containing protein n=1 Tax=Extremus antarcticus TaxID=702011 RepID=A0AAJ0DKJ4_9PEZI|nr:hypothetical protein LTR09_007316 [Extremus antarcticus]
MASPAKPPAPAKKAGGWGSLLSGAVAGIESRLDTILANEEAAGEANGAAKPAKPGQPPESGTSTLAPPKVPDARARSPSRTRPSDRLAERLAKATAVKTPTGTGSTVPSRTATPDNERQSVDEGPSFHSEAYILPAATESTVIPVVETSDAPESTDVGKDVDSRLSEDGSAFRAVPRASADSSRPSTDVTQDDSSSRPSADVPNGTPPTALSSKSAGEYEAELHIYMEKIDALQAKLSYLANSTVAAAKAANASADTTGPEKDMAKKDEQIALLMEEGEKLSKTELRHLQTIKKLRSQHTEHEKVLAEARKKSDKTESDLRQRVRKVEQALSAAGERNKVIAGIEKEVEELRKDRENAAALVKSLTAQLKEAKERAEKAEREAKDKSTSEIDRGRIAALENEVEDAQIEKKLADDRAAAEIRKVKEDLESQTQRFSVRELEMKNEISGLESRLEAMRSRAEYQGVDSSTGETSVQLLRQVETLQRQYALAKENWEAIEASLNGRVIGLEKERDEVGRREAEARKRVREVGQKGRKMEDELEERTQERRRLADELEKQKETVGGLHERLAESQRVVEDAKADVEKQKRVWEVEMQQKVEEERTKWHQGRAMQSIGLRNQSPATNSRKTSTVEVNALNSRRPGMGNRLTSHDLAALHTEPSRPSSRRSPGHPPPRVNSTHAPQERSSEASPSMSRQESIMSLTTTADFPPTPSFEINQYDTSASPEAETPHTPDDGHTLADLLSTSTTPAAGPSVQLVERMSLLVRRLESEKAGFKDEMARVASQRDGARDEIVMLMREVDAKRNGEEKSGKLQSELDQLKGRYDASLEMLGEREEEVTELRSDMAEMKRLYRELADRKMGRE